MADYIAILTNCITTGDEFTESAGVQIRNFTRFNLDGFTIDLVQNPLVISINALQNIIGQQFVTSELVFRNVTEADFDRIQATTEIICEMLSFALESRVGFHGYDFPERGALRQRIATVGTVETFRPPFFWKNGSQIKRFIEICYATYKNLRTPRTLNVAVDYLHQAALHTLAVEVKLCVLFVLLEHLKHTFALSQGYPFIKGFFRGHGATAAAPGGKLSFRHLLTEMFAGVQMAPDLTPIIDLRNELIHSGLSSLAFQSKWSTAEEVETIIREYILRLLNYTGEFFPYTTTGPRVI